MVQPLLIKGGRILDPGRGMDETGNLLLDSNGVIIWQGPDDATPPQTDFTILNASGLTVCPGFIDLHCHLRQPGYEEKETIRTGTLAAAKGGFTTVCCMPNTEPPLDNPGTVNYVKDIGEKEGIVRILPIAAVTKGRQGRELSPLAELAELGIAGFSDDGSPVYDADMMTKALERCREPGLPVIDHCEDTGLAGNGVMNEGVVSARLSLKGIPAAAEENMVARDLRLARLTGGWVHIAHASTAGSVDLIRKAKAEGVRVTAEVTPHHLTLTDEEVVRHGSNAKVNPPLRTANDIEALIEGLNDDTIDIIATDHAPHTAEDKNTDISLAASGFSCFETAFGSLMSLVDTGKVELETIIMKLTRRPAMLLGERHGVSGMLTTGSPADIVIFDPVREWVVNPEEFLSKGKNTPLTGATLKGKVMVTISRGKIVYKDDSIRLGEG